MDPDQSHEKASKLTAFPVARVKKQMQLVPEIDKLSAESIVAVAKATVWRYC